jgi:hypothetical protein
MSFTKRPATANPVTVMVATANPADDRESPLRIHALNEQKPCPARLL